MSEIPNVIVFGLTKLLNICMLICIQIILYNIKVDVGPADIHLRYPHREHHDDFEKYDADLEFDFRTLTRKGFGN